MATSSVVVHDIDRLESFGSFLLSKRDDIENLYDELVTACGEQDSNWQDPQYTELKEKLDSFSATSKTQLEELDDAVAYIVALVEKLRTI